MADAGKLTLGVVWDGNSVSATEIRSSRPMVAQVLQGKPPKQVAQIVPMLFSVCGRAHGSAANAAMQAARQATELELAGEGRAIACEAMQEHLWRVMLDWPRLAGLPQQEQKFAGWYAMLRRIAAGEIAMSAFLRELERDWLRMPAPEWREFDSLHALQAWWHKADSPVAQLLEKLAGKEHGRPTQSDLRLLPAWSAADAYQSCAGRWGVHFSACPDWQGVAAETGAWTYYADRPLLHDVWERTGSKALMRLMARIVDVVEMASGNAAPRLDVASPAAGEGIAVVRTARGLLIHHVRIAAEKVADYAIVAPTEWNFHPAGAFAQDIIGLQAGDEDEVKRRAQIAALSLDPCVAYDIEVRHA